MTTYETFMASSGFLFFCLINIAAAVVFARKYPVESK